MGESEGNRIGPLESIITHNLRLNPFSLPHSRHSVTRVMYLPLSFPAEEKQGITQRRRTISTTTTATTRAIVAAAESGIMDHAARAEALRQMVS